MTRGRAWIPVAALLAAVYLATSAPDVTFWDAGEFITAAHALGIPHPPGTPLFVLLLHSWGLAWPDTMYAIGTNAFSALCTVVAACLSASLVARWMRDRADLEFGFVAGIAAAVCAGTMSTVWSNATETEVYAASLALAVVMLFVADRAGRSGDRRWRVLLAYCFGLAAPLHVSALVAAPAAILLASTLTSDGAIDRPIAIAVSVGALVAMAIGTLSLMFIAAAGVAAAVATFAALRVPRVRRATLAELGCVVGGALLGATPLLFLVVRAQFDPPINQGNPSSVHALMDVVARRQYDLAPLWPRRAPFWIQLGNWFEYADWQSALSLGPTVIPTVQRVAVSLVFGMLGLCGAMAHHRVDRRSWRALLALFLAGSLGVIIYLNLRASPSFGWGVLPATVEREARERDYFFVLGFWAVGLWAGIGAVVLARRLRVPLVIGLAVAESTIALNWTAVGRRGEPEASLPRRVAVGLLSAAPPRAVLFVAGDNDTYPLWYAQEVLQVRRDVTVVTLPLLGAAWYDAEIRRRNPSLRTNRVGDDPAHALADAARDNGRPVAAALTLTATDRARLHGCWSVAGLVVIDRVHIQTCRSASATEGTDIVVDTAQTRRWVKQFDENAVQSPVRPSIDQTGDYFEKLLECPIRILRSAHGNRRGVSLDSTCNP